MQLEEAAQHAGEHVAEPFDAGKTIIEHVSNSSIDHPLIHLPSIIPGVDLSVTKHVLMLWIVAGLIFVVVTLAVRRYFHVVPFGCVETESSRVLRMEEKPTLTRLVNAGIYVLDPAVVARAPRDQQIGMPGLLEQCMDLGEGVGAFEIEADWIDVGQREQLKLAREGES